MRTCSGNQEIKQRIITISYGYRNSSMSKMEFFVTTVNDWKPLTVVKNSPFLNVGLTNFADFVYFFIICKV